jgi:hypothetical protein
MRVAVRVNTNNHSKSFFFKSMETNKIIYICVYFCSIQTFRTVNAKHTKLYTGLDVCNMRLDIFRRLNNMTLCASYMFNFEFKI